MSMVSRIALLLTLSNLLLPGECACEEKIIPYANKNILASEDGNILSNTTVTTQDECRDVCCSTALCEMAVFTGSAEDENCVLYHCAVSCDEGVSNGTVLLVKKAKEAVEDLEPKVEIETAAQVDEEEASKSALHLSKATAITLLVVGVLAFVTVVGVFTFKCVEWSPRRRYNRIDFLMNDVDD